MLNKEIMRSDVRYSIVKLILSMVRFSLSFIAGERKASASNTDVVCTLELLCGYFVVVTILFSADRIKRELHYG